MTTSTSSARDGATGIQGIRRSLLGLNATNFFQAEMVGVVLPVLNVFLRERTGATIPLASPLRPGRLVLCFSRLPPAC